jgi:hypothetical protein
VETAEGDIVAQYGCLNFHAKRDGGPKLSLTIKNKVVIRVDKGLVLQLSPMPLDL